MRALLLIKCVFIFFQVENMLDVLIGGKRRRENYLVWAGNFFIRRQSVLGFPSKNKEGKRNFGQMGVVKNRPGYEYVFLP